MAHADVDMVSCWPRHVIMNVGALRWPRTWLLMIALATLSSGHQPQQPRQIRIAVVVGDQTPEGTALNFMMEVFILVALNRPF